VNNILLLVWDAARSDVAEKYAPNLCSLAAENVKFTQAKAPADYSLPSHVSIFTGSHPHEHQCCTPEDYVGGERVTLVNELNDKGYRTYGVSANKFAGEAYGFDEPFDEFYDTYPSFPGADDDAAGIDIRAVSTELAEYPVRERYARYLLRALKHDQPVRSLRNLAVRFVREMSRDSDLLRTLHPQLHYNTLYRYSPDTNTDRISQIISAESETDAPFFLFSNYLDTHRPYIPPTEFQQEILGRTLSFKEIEYLNEFVAHPWRFIEAVAAESLDETEVETVRDLYAAEMRSVDAHLELVRAQLLENGLLEDTVIIVTADHGENLGEVDVRGERRMGHKESFTEALLNVPLVVIHPKLSPQLVDKPVSLTRLFDFCLGCDDCTDDLIDGTLCAEDGAPVVSECPANHLHTDAAEEFPGAPEYYIHRMNYVDTVVAWADGWKVVVDSEDETWAWKDGERREISEAPGAVVDRCQEYVESLGQIERGTALSEMSDETIEQLKQMGYL
jgi:arylsulfatase A-like enzyme